jgi:hypothetical protein
MNIKRVTTSFRGGSAKKAAPAKKKASPAKKSAKRA